MSQIQRLLTNVMKDSNNKQTFHSIFNKYREYSAGAKTPIPNQAFAPNIKSNGQPMSIYFDEYATNRLHEIRDLAQEQTLFREKNGQKDRSIEFVCEGYIDNAGDMVIIDITIPSLDIFAEKQLTYQNFFQTTIPRDAHIDTIAMFHDHLRDSVLSNKDGKIGSHLVSLLGTTRPVIEETEIQNCLRLSELADATIKGDIILNHPVVTGVLSISPKTLTKKANEGYILTDGSLECAVINYKYNNNGTVKPTKITNVISAYETINGKISNSLISSSMQPTSDIITQAYLPNNQGM